MLEFEIGRVEQKWAADGLFSAIMTETKALFERRDHSPLIETRFSGNTRLSGDTAPSEATTFLGGLPSPHAQKVNVPQLHFWSQKRCLGCSARTEIPLADRFNVRNRTNGVERDPDKTPRRAAPASPKNTKEFIENKINNTKCPQKATSNFQVSAIVQRCCFLQTLCILLVFSVFPFFF